MFLYSVLSKKIVSETKLRVIMLVLLALIIVIVALVGN